MDFFTGSFLCGFYFVVTVFDDRFSGYDPDEGALVIYHRHEVLINGAIQKIFHIGICMAWCIGGATWDRHDRDSFCFLDVVDICTAHALEELSRRDGAVIFAVHGEDWNAGGLAVLHFFEGLAKSFILKDVGYFAFGNQKKQNVHVITSFPRKL